MRAPRRANDRYLTPRWAYQALLQYFPELRGEVLLDPCAGDGRMAAALAHRFDQVRLNDIAPAEGYAGCAAVKALTDGGEGFSTLDAADPALYVRPASWVVTNPPFTCAGDITHAALQGTTQGVAMLLRATFGEPCGPCSRAPRNGRRWLIQHPPTALLMLPRISFTGDGNSDCAAAWWWIWCKDGSIAPRIRAAVREDVDQLELGERP